MPEKPPNNIFWEIHSGLPREGPGDNASTQRAFELIPDLPARPQMLDIGCGPGMQTLLLAHLSGGQVTAVDTHQPFLDELQRRAKAAGCAKQIQTLAASMFELPFAAQHFDLIWCEGAMYFLGFSEALRRWQAFLRPGGYLAVTEPCWLQPDPPAEVCAHWAEYPGMADIASCQQQIQAAGYSELGHFVLPDAAWWNDYYHPLAARIQDLRQRYAGQPGVMAQLAEAQHEIDFHRAHSAWYGYVFFVLQS